MKRKRLTERELRGIAHEVPQGRRSWDPYYQAVLECLSYRRALRKVRNELRQWCANHQISHDGARPFAMGHLVEIMEIIDRALGAKR